MDYPVYDFVTASRVERPLAAALKNWFNKFNNRLKERWSDFSPAEITVSSCLINALSFEATKGKWIRPMVASPITIQAADKRAEVPGLIVAENSDIVILMMEVLAESLTQRPSDRQLTSIELTMCQLLFQTATSVLGESWPEKESIPVTLGEFDFQPNNNRLFAPNKEVIVTGFEVRTSSSEAIGPARIEWVLAKQELMNLLGISAATPAVSNHEKIKPELVNEIQVELTAMLGATELSMEALLEMAPGAIIRLDQRFDEPLSLSLNGEPKLRGWPGISQRKPCVLIESISQ